MYKHKLIVSHWGAHKFKEGVHFQELPFFDALVEACIGDSKKVLDIGVGDGRMPRNILKHCQPEFYGIDLTEQMKFAPVIRVCGDARALPFSSNIFDVVYSLGVIEHFPETGLALSEHVRVLRPGGKLFITTPHLSLATVYKLMEFYSSKKWIGNTFEAVRGRNLRLSEVEYYLNYLPVKILSLSTCGVREAKTPFKRIIKRIIPDFMQQPHLYCIAEKELVNE
jgi:SAM-dependent methyltransferase